ncbi:MAG: hypothetical protein MHM6MM_004976, partial [Cercozoa sp. M6MM]
LDVLRALPPSCSAARRQNKGVRTAIVGTGDFCRIATCNQGSHVSPQQPAALRNYLSVIVPGADVRDLRNAQHVVDTRAVQNDAAALEHSKTLFTEKNAEFVLLQFTGLLQAVQKYAPAVYAHETQLQTLTDRVPEQERDSVRQQLESMHASVVPHTCDQNADAFAQAAQLLDQQVGELFDSLPLGTMLCITSGDLDTEDNRRLARFRGLCRNSENNTISALWNDSCEQMLRESRDAANAGVSFVAIRNRAAKERRAAAGATDEAVNDAENSATAAVAAADTEAQA